MKIAIKYLSLVLVSIFIFPILTLTQATIAYASDPKTEQTESTQKLTPEETEMFESWTRILKSSIKGPAKIPLIDQATLNLSENYLFIPSKEAADFERLMGNTPNSDYVGLIISNDLKFDWHILVTYSKEGYIKEDDAKNLKAEDLLKIMRENTGKDNKSRIEKGFSPLEIVGWIEPPAYNFSTHQLAFSVLAKEGDEEIANCRAMSLGREGFFIYTLVTYPSSISRDKLYLNKMLSSLHYNEGKRYENFVESSDRTAKYGLAALITGVAAKKTGLLAILGVFVIKM